MRGSVVFDTNAIIDLFKGRIDIELIKRETFGKEQCISIITYIELLAFPGILPDEEQKITAFLSKRRIVPVNAGIAQRAVEFRRTTKRKLADSIIAATAIVLDANLLTHDAELLSAEFPNLKPIETRA